MTRLNMCMDYLLSVLECVLSLALVTFGLSLPAVSCLQAITSGGAVVAVLGSVLLCAVVTVYAMIAYEAVTAAVSRTHYLY